MIPQFPDFCSITLEHRAEIEHFWSRFEPYSDYNFTGMYSYNTGGLGSVSMLSDNLVIKFPDYNTNMLTLSFLGTNLVNQTAITLLELAKKESLQKKLTLIGQVVIDSFQPDEELIAEEDVDNNDYIIAAHDLTTLTGNKWYKLKRQVRLFTKLYPNYKFPLIDISDSKVRNEMMALFHLWESQKSKDRKETSTELEAFTRSFELFDSPDHFAFGLYVDNKMVGYSTNQIVQKKYYMGHFGKADANYPGAYQLMEHECAKFFVKKGCEFMNYEQDLGIPGLRQAKKSWHPVKYLKKYMIRPIGHFDRLSISQVM